MNIISYALIVYLAFSVIPVQALEYDNATYGIHFNMPEDWINQGLSGVEEYERRAESFTGIDIDYSAVFTSKNGNAWILIQEIPASPSEYFKYIRKNIREMSEKYGVEVSIIKDQDNMLLYETRHQNGGGLAAAYGTSAGIFQLSLNSDNSDREVYAPIFTNILDSVSITETANASEQMNATSDFNWGHIFGSAIAAVIFSMVFFPSKKKKPSESAVMDTSS